MAHQVQRGLVRLWRRATLLLASDQTPVVASAGGSCLVVAPHPDDETLGCGATIARRRAAGAAVTVLIAADGRYSHRMSRLLSPDDMRALRMREAVAASAALGVDQDHLVQLGHEDTFLADAWDSLVESLHSVLDRVDPDEILVVSGLDAHPDHRTLNAALHHVLQTDSRPRRVWEFPIWSWADGPWFELSRYRPIERAMHLLRDPVVTLFQARRLPIKVSTAGFAAAKRSALAAYRSQTSNLTAEPDWPIMDERFLAHFLGRYEVFLRPRPYGRTTSR